MSVLRRKCTYVAFLKQPSLAKARMSVSAGDIRAFASDDCFGNATYVCLRRLN